MFALAGAVNLAFVKERDMTRRDACAATIAVAISLFIATVSGAQSVNDAVAVEAWLKGYDAVFLSKDLSKIAPFYHPDVTIYEGAGVNNGWVDYRDRHLGPELKSFENLEFAHSGTKITMLPGGESAYATSRYTIKARMGDRTLDNEGLETLLLVKTPEGWKIRHSHTSGRARRPTP
ncbi:MAG TPA: nuclear transport factor 2 family protein [Vicinamibacterales bacterium]